MKRLNDRDSETMSLWLEILKTRVETGEPYIMFKDSVNKNNPLAYAMNNLDVSMTNICTEITLHTDERRDAVLAARKLKAEKLAEEALDIADQADETSNSGVNKARLQVDTRKWMASKLDPENYGDTAKTQVNISLGDLHLQALKHMGKADVILENNGT